MLPLIQKEIVEKENWATEDEVMNYFAVGQCTPGVIAVNTATFVGHKIKKTMGGIFATIGVITPSVIIISIIAQFLKTFAEVEAVEHAFNGIRVAVTVLILNAVIKFWKSGIKDAIGIVIFLAVITLSIFLNLSSVYIVIGALILGILFGIRREKVEK
jgi:chromate transporter